MIAPSSSITRRDFIKVASTAGAGLVLGFTLPTRRAPGSPVVAQSPAAFSPNAWISINRDGTTSIVVAKSEMGQGVMTALPMIVAEELDADWGSVRAEQAIADNKHGSMGTGGSTSVRTSWEMLRKAGATGRAMLIAAAAKMWNVDPSSCRTEKGTVVHPPTGRKLTYGALTDAAAELPVPDHVTLKDPADFRIVGLPTLRIDSPEKVDGSAAFGIDIRREGMLYASVERCPVFGGTVSRFDAARTKAVPGVKDVIQIESGVAVVATSTWAALKGREVLNVAWNEGPHASLNSAGIRKLLEEASRRRGATAEEKGDAAGVLSKAAKKTEAIYELPFLAHATMEPMNCTADVRRDACEVWAPTQGPQGIQEAAARITGLDPAGVTVHTTFLGGGFGRRADDDFALDALHISKAVGAPVKVTWTREDDMQHDGYRPVSLHRLAGAVNATGDILAWTHRITAPSINEQHWAGSVKDGLDHSAVEGAVEMPYDIPNLLVEYVMANTPIPIWYWRSVYPSQNVFAVESFIDELAAAAKKDPFEFRRRLMAKSPRMRAVLELAAEKAGWGTTLPKGRHRGIAFSPPAFFQTPVAQVAEISVSPDKTVRVHRVVCAVDCGIAVNPKTIEAQMEGGIVYGLTAALKGEITIEKGRVSQGNFDDYPLLSIDEMPEIEVHIVKSSAPPSGTGEPGLPAIAPAVANAIYAATRKRVRRLPIAF